MNISRAFSLSSPFASSGILAVFPRRHKPNSLPMPNNVTTFFAAIIAAIITAYNAVMGKVPNHLETAFWVATMLIVADAITGYWFALITKTYSSNKAREKLFAKTVQYGGIGVVVVSGAIVAKTPMIVTIFLYMICSIEASSILENAVKLERKGVPLGPLRPFVERIGKYFAVAGDGAMVTITAPATGNTAIAVASSGAADAVAVASPSDN